jgi:Putative peptidoglycan binding domain
VPSECTSMTATLEDDDRRHAGRFTAWLARALRRRPADSGGLFVALAATAAVVINALYLQSGPHPAPLFSVRSRPVTSSDSTGAIVKVLVPRPRVPDLAGTKVDPATGARARPDLIADIQRELERRGVYDGPVDGVDGPKTDAAIREFVQAANIRWNGEPSEDLLRAIMHSAIKSPARDRSLPATAGGRTDAIGDLIVTSSRRTLAVQRALSDFGYGPIKPTGLFGVETKIAIEKFERDRRLPVTGQISDRLLRELAAMTGRAIE